MLFLLLSFFDFLLLLRALTSRNCSSSNRDSSLINLQVTKITLDQNPALKTPHTVRGRLASRERRHPCRRTTTTARRISNERTRWIAGKTGLLEAFSNHSNLRFLIHVLKIRLFVVRALRGCAKPRQKRFVPTRSQKRKINSWW